jgi:hypothetical protein
MAFEFKDRRWKGLTAVVMASGPSLSEEQVEHVRRARAADLCRVMTVNTTFKAALWADVAYAGDTLWWSKHVAVAKKTFQGELWTQDNVAAARYQLHRVRGAPREGLGTYEIHQNGNSGMQAVNLAFLWGAYRILLLGFDMKEGPNGEKHHHPDHPRPCVQRQLFGEWIHKARPVAEGLKKHWIQVVNCTPGSALPWFPMSEITRELPCPSP